MTKLAFYLRSAQYRMGSLGVLGLLFLLTAALIYAGLSRPQLKQLQASEVTLSQAKQQRKQIQVTPIATTTQATVNAASYLQQFPNVNHKDDALKTIIAIAENNKLPLETGTYNTVTKEAGQVVFYEINLPLKGSYPQIKQFVASTMNALPNAALSTFHLQQTNTEANLIEAEVVLTLYFSKAAIK
ncbi:MAG TPA: hypothetical protein PLG02_07220 [Methylotenera sp.]|nr:hypothetical protein [Methylotenera sp.]HQO16738.1 hypothetical protein [Methylotenera sp.]